MTVQNTTASVTLAANDLEVLYEQASFLMSQGDLQAARDKFMQVLSTNPAHLGTLINFAVLLVETGYNSAAKTAYQQALTLHPNNLLAHVNLANLYFQERRFKEAHEHYDKVLRLYQSLGAQEQVDENAIGHCAHAHQGLALIYFEEGLQEKADFHLAQGFILEPRRAHSIPGNRAAKSLLVLIGGRGGDIPWPTIVDPKLFAVDTLAVEFWDDLSQNIKSLPKYDLILNAIGDADSSSVSLRAAEKFLKSYQHVKLLNPPTAVLLTGRISNAQRFKSLPFVKTANSVIAQRQDLQDVRSVERFLDSKISFPVVIRSLGFQTGKHFELASTPRELVSIARTLPGEQLLVMEFLGTQDDEGYFRKYRVMFIDGEIYPLHLALSKHWKVHYFSAEMKDSAENRLKEQYFLENMRLSLGEKPMTALKAIKDTLGLDYAGLDFGLSPQGTVWVYEANATMIMAMPPSDGIWDYRRNPIQIAKDAAKHMLYKKASSDN